MPVHIDELQTDIDLRGDPNASPTTGERGLDDERLRRILRPLIQEEVARAFESWRRQRR